MNKNKQNKPTLLFFPIFIAFSILFSSSGAAASQIMDTNHILGNPPTQATEILSDLFSQTDVIIYVYLSDNGFPNLESLIQDASETFHLNNLSVAGIPKYNLLIYSATVNGKQYIEYVPSKEYVCKSFVDFLNQNLVSGEITLDKETILKRITDIATFIKSIHKQQGSDWPKCVGSVETEKEETELQIGKDVYLVDDTNWKSVLSLIPLTTRHFMPEGLESLSDAQKLAERKNHVQYSPTFVYHSENEQVDLDSIILLLRQFSPGKITIVHDEAVPMKIASIMEKEKWQYEYLSPAGYAEKWKTEEFDAVVLSQDDYKTGLMASVFASYMHAPLIFSASELDNYNNYMTVYCVGVQVDACTIKFTLGELQKNYTDITGTDKVVLVNPKDIEEKSCESFEYVREFGKLTKAYCKDSLVSPILASVKNELIIFTENEPLSEGLRLTDPETQGFYSDNDENFYFLYGQKIEKVNFNKKTKEILDYNPQNFPATPPEKQETYKEMLEEKIPPIKYVFVNDNTGTVYVLLDNSGSIIVYDKSKLESGNTDFNKMVNSRHTCFSYADGKNSEKTKFENELSQKSSKTIEDIEKQTDMTGNNYMTIISSPKAIPSSTYAYCVDDAGSKGKYIDFRNSLDPLFSKGKAVGRIFGITVSDTSSYINRVVVFSKKGYSYIPETGVKNGLRQFKNVSIMAANVPDYQTYVPQLKGQLLASNYNTLCFVGNDVEKLSQNGCVYLEEGKFSDGLKQTIIENDIIIYDNDGKSDFWKYPQIYSKDVKKYEASSAIVIAATCSGLDYYSSYGEDMLSLNFIKSGALGYYGATSTTLWNHIAAELITRILATDSSGEKTLNINVEGYDLGNALASATRDSDVKSIFDGKKVTPNYALLGDPTVQPALQKFDVKIQKQAVEKDYYCYAENGKTKCETKYTCPQGLDECCIRNPDLGLLHSKRCNEQMANYEGGCAGLTESGGKTECESVTTSILGIDMKTCCVWYKKPTSNTQTTTGAKSAFTVCGYGKSPGDSCYGDGKLEINDGCIMTGSHEQIIKTCRPCKCKCRNALANNFLDECTSRPCCIYEECFLGGTKIMTSSGESEIENIKTGDQILSYNEKTGTNEFSDVAETFIHESVGEYLVINGFLKVTPNHPLWINGDWARADSAKPGDVLKDVDGNPVVIESIETNTGPVTVYNLDVSDTNTFYAESILVHNKDCFVAGTNIAMADGTTKNIEDVQIGDVVMTVNTKTMGIENRLVLAMLSQLHTGEGTDLTIKITFPDGTINQNTNTHPYYTETKGWASYEPELTKEKYGISVSRLENGDVVYRLSNGALSEIEIANIEEVHEPVVTYNLMRVEDNSNFFANGILVHNKETNDIYCYSQQCCYKNTDSEWVGCKNEHWEQCKSQRKKSSCEKTGTKNNQQCCEWKCGEEEAKAKKCCTGSDGYPYRPEDCSGVETYQYDANPQYCGCV